MHALIAGLLYRGLYDHVLKLTRTNRDPAFFVSRVLEIDHMYSLLELLNQPNEAVLKEIGLKIKSIGAGILPSINQG